MTNQRKILVLIPPLLIGISLLLVFFTIEHRQQLQNEQLPDQIATTTTEQNNTTPTPPAQPNQPDAPTSSDDPVFCTLEAKMCPDGSYVGRVAPNCEFAACPGEVSDPDPAFITCPAGSRAVDACIEIYQPVCAAVEVQCVTTPCEPQPTTYPNSCFACMDESVIGYHEGACAAATI